MEPYSPDTYFIFTYKGTEYRERGQEPRRARLWLDWTIPTAHDVTNDVRPDDPECDADSLLGRWIAGLDWDYDHSGVGLGADWLRIHWGVTSPDGNMAEFMPFQAVDDKDDTFLTYFTWPTLESGEPINWLRCHVEDVHWEPGDAANGGFLQEATGWKPSPLQCLVHIGQFDAVRR